MYICGFSHKTNGGVIVKYFGDELSAMHRELTSVIRKADGFEHGMDLFLRIHSMLHSGEVSGTGKNNIDGLTDDLKPEEYYIMPGARDETIAWSLWHIARIEDLTMGILAADGGQVFDESWKLRMKTAFTDTGNAMTDDEIMLISKNIVIDELLKYRCAVGKRTREICGALSGSDMKKRVSDKSLDRIFSEGGVTPQENSVWLLDFWGEKDIAGLLLMPASRHEIIHLNSCFKYKDDIRTKKRFYREQ